MAIMEEFESKKGLKYMVNCSRIGRLSCKSGEIVLQRVGTEERADKWCLGIEAELKGRLICGRVYEAATGACNQIWGQAVASDGPKQDKGFLRGGRHAKLRSREDASLEEPEHHPAVVAAAAAVAGQVRLMLQVQACVEHPAAVPSSPSPEPRSCSHPLLPKRMANRPKEPRW